MKFSHLADCHIGSFKEPKLSKLSTNAFLTAIDLSIKKDVDFILISGDLFNTALPQIDKLKSVVLKLKELKDNQIPVYIVAGSHDFSSTGKTMLDVLEAAGLVINVTRGKIKNEKLFLDFTIDSKTGAKITGMLGRKGTLEKNYYKDLDLTNLETQDGFKIFMFHSAISELKPKYLELMDSIALSNLPKNFNYYAGGHVHEVIEYSDSNYKNVIFPGPIFPNNFKEIEKLNHGGFYIYDDGKITFEKIILHDVISINLNCENLTPKEINLKLNAYIDENKKKFYEKIITMRLFGKINGGKIYEINLNEVIDRFYEYGAYFVMKNASMLVTIDFQEIKTKEESISEIEDKTIKEHLTQIPINTTNEFDFTKKLMDVFSIEENEDEKKSDFESRIKEEADLLIKNLLK
ncbi:MAG: metallophosphoesterase family protein [Nanoarchaeota archaeon]